MTSWPYSIGFVFFRPGIWTSGNYGAGTNACMNCVHNGNKQGWMSRNIIKSYSDLSDISKYKVILKICRLGSE